MRGVVPVRRDVVFVHHAWTIPDALALRASGQIPSFAHRLLAPLQVGLKTRSQNHFNVGNGQRRGFIFHHDAERIPVFGWVVRRPQVVQNSFS